MSEETVLTFSKEKETKNTVRYSEDDRPGELPIVGKLYLQKWFAEGRDAITLVIR